MKPFFTLILLVVCSGAFAQRSTSKQITNDGRRLHIRVDLEEAGRSIHYSRSFDVEDLDDDDVKELENSVLDSLDQALTERSNDLKTIDRRYSAASKKYKETNTTYSTNTHDSESRSMTANASSTLSPSDVAPSSVQVKEDKENGRLWMQYTFEKDGEELVIERTANVLGKSEREKQAIIKETERSFGIKTGNQ